MIVEKKEVFLRQLREFASQLEDKVAAGGEWNVRGFIDRYRQVYGISDDTKVISKVLELQLFPYFQIFAEEHGYILELSDKQNYYPDMTFIDARDETIKFAVDLKSTYRDEKHPDFCKGFTLGSFGKYFIDRTSRKNIMYPYGEYAAHIIFGIIYSRSAFSAQEATRPYRVEDVERIPAVAREFLFLVEEKWKLASDKKGSGNTANIGSIKYIPDLLQGNGVFSRCGEDIFDDYWMNYGRMIVRKNHKAVKLSSLPDYLKKMKQPLSLYSAPRQQGNER